MTVQQLKNRLQELDPDDVVEIWDPDWEDWFPITGYTFGGADHKVRLYTE